MTFVVTIEREVCHLMRQRTITDKWYFDTEKEARDWADDLPNHPYTADWRVISIEPHRPRVWWIVTYDYTGSRYFDSPFRRVTEREAFDTYQEALAWSKAPHPEFLNFCTLDIHQETETTYMGHSPNVYPGSAEAYDNSNRNTDAAILGF